MNSMHNGILICASSGNISMNCMSNGLITRCKIRHSTVLWPDSLKWRLAEVMSPLDNGRVVSIGSTRGNNHSDHCTTKVNLP
jgi:hypothetical protein